MEKGIGARIDRKASDAVSHEVLFEDAVATITDRPLYVGSPIPRRRFFIVLGVAILGVGALFGRVFWMQIIDGERYRTRAEENRLRVEVVPARRGLIRDRTGAVLAENIPSFDVMLIPWLLPRDPIAQETRLALLSHELNRPLAEIESIIVSSTNLGARIALARDIPYEQAIAILIRFADDPAIHVLSTQKRRYPSSGELQSLSHLLGYTGPISPDELERFPGKYQRTDVIGKSGIEASAEERLRGKHGYRQHEIDAKNHVTSLVRQEAPEDGQEVTLALDLELQRAAETSLRRWLITSSARRGAVIALNPRDGSLLAAVSLPAYDDNLFSGTVSSTYYMSLLEDADHPLVPRAWAGVYPSGSTIKPVIAAAGLAEHVITDRTSINSVGGLRIGSSFFPDWKAGGHGMTNVRKAIAWSVNTFFYELGGGYDTFIGLGVDRLAFWMKKFGFGERTGLDLPGESPGLVPTKEWKERERGERWYIGDTYNLSIGQGDLLVTPLQIAVATAEIANGGKKIRPHVMEHENMKTREQIIGDPSVIRTVQLGMRDTVIYGSGRALASFPVKVAAKTGTAQWRKDRPNHAWFTAYAPFENPEIVVTVLVEEGGEGSSAALPVAREVLEAWMRIRASGT